jgi:uncharacterized membrane protein YcgQ (UPF0703/DUF1980 family)
VVAGPTALPRARQLLALALAAALAGCGVGIADINARPDRHYQKRVALTGRIARRQVLPEDTLLELADARGRRLLVRVKGAVDFQPGDWVRVRGLLVPETRVGDALLYDVLEVEKVEAGRAPRLPAIM